MDTRFAHFACFARFAVDQKIATQFAPIPKTLPAIFQKIQSLLKFEGIIKIKVWRPSGKDNIQKES
jgi:hypothetical protein